MHSVITTTTYKNYTTTDSKTIYFLRFYFYFLFFGERRREGERKGVKHWYVKKTSIGTPPTGELAHNPGMCPNQESNQ